MWLETANIGSHNHSQPALRRADMCKILFLHHTFEINELTTLLATETSPTPTTIKKRDT